MNNPNYKNAAPIMMALLVTAGFFFFIYLLYVSKEIPEKNLAQLNIFLGGIAVVWAKAIGFFYDSSASSKAKDETLMDIAKQPAGTGATGATGPTGATGATGPTGASALPQKEQP